MKVTLCLTIPQMDALVSIAWKTDDPDLAGKLATEIFIARRRLARDLEQQLEEHLHR